MSNKNIYTWEVNDEAYLSQDKKYDINDHIFLSCKPLDKHMKGDEYRNWAKAIIPAQNMFANQKENTDQSPHPKLFPYLHYVQEPLELLILYSLLILDLVYRSGMFRLVHYES